MVWPRLAEPSVLVFKVEVPALFMGRESVTHHRGGGAGPPVAGVQDTPGFPGGPQATSRQRQHQPMARS